MTDLSPPVCNTLWIGPALGAVERACLRSVMRHGHRLVVHCYDEVKGLPEGVEVADAEQVLPRVALDGLETRPALVSDLFRYRLQSLGRGLWVDADVYCLAPLVHAGETRLIGWQEPGVLNGAVLLLPQDCPMLAPLLEQFEQRRAPPWATEAERRAMHERLARTGLAGLVHAGWDIAGPRALSAAAGAAGLQAHALPRDVFYPAHWRFASWIGSPGVLPEFFTTERSRCLHLWNERIRGFKDAPARAGSFLARLQEEGG